MKKFMVLAMVVALFSVALPMTSAQSATRTVTFTETDINESFWVTNPANRNLSNAYVDLQADGQVTLSALYTWRTRTGTRSTTLAAVITPRISNGRLQWDVVEITADGQPASASLVAQVNNHLMASWRRWINANAPEGMLTVVTISDDALALTYAAG
jgi:hypothetical protein